MAEMTAEGERALAREIVAVVMAACDKHGPIAPRYAEELVLPILLRAPQPSGLAAPEWRVPDGHCVVCREDTNDAEDVLFTPHGNSVCSVCWQSIIAMRGEPAAPESPEAVAPGRRVENNPLTPGNTFE